MTLAPVLEVEAALDLLAARPLVVLTVVSQGWTGTTGWVSVLSLDDGSMTNRMVEVEHGSDVADVRLVPLQSGRVALVTGEDVSFFAL